jgi:hypothetical protein
MTAPKLAILGQSNPAATTNTDLYTVPTARRAVVSTIVICEQGGGTPTVRVYARINGAAAAVGNAVVYELPLAANQHVGITEGWTLAAGDVITVRASTTGVSFTLFGNEEDVPTA